MEQLQRQHGVKKDMNLQEKHLLQAQLLFAQHAAAAAARASGSRLDAALSGKADRQTYQAAQQVSSSHLGRMDADEEDEDSDDDEDDEEDLLEPEENDEMEEEEESGPNQQAKKLKLQQVPGFPFNPYSTSQSAAEKQLSASPPPAIKQEKEEKDLLSPAGQPTFTSPNGFTDWGYDEAFKQVSVFDLCFGVFLE